MVFDIKPRLDRFVPKEMENGSFGIIDLQTGELLRKKDQPLRLERFGFISWAKHRCNILNTEEKSCKD